MGAIRVYNSGRGGHRVGLARGELWVPLPGLLCHCHFRKAEGQRESRTRVSMGRRAPPSFRLQSPRQTLASRGSWRISLGPLLSPSSTASLGEGGQGPPTGVLDGRQPPSGNRSRQLILLMRAPPGKQLPLCFSPFGAPKAFQAQAPLSTAMAAHLRPSPGPHSPGSCPSHHPAGRQR